jgi:hypothetical protein
MNNTTNQAIEGATMTVGQTKSRYGNPEPQVEVRMPKGSHHRRLNAALHLLAADAELATSTAERWVVQTETTSDERGRLYLELADATPAEAEQAMAMLRRICR